LHTTFWILELNATLKKGVSFNNIEDLPVPILIGNFIEKFNF